MPKVPSIPALDSREHVLAAISLYDELGREEFLSRYGYGPALRYVLRHDGKTYEQKAIAGVAWGLQLFNDPARRPEAFAGGARSSIPTLERLGFEVEPVAGLAEKPSDLVPELEPGRTYDWDELGETFRFPPNYLGRVGGMVSRPEQRSLLLITHNREGGGFSYGDRWDGDDLIYAGRGLTGHQELAAQNRQVAENSRALFLFEASGSRALHYHGRVRCTRFWESTGPDREGNERRVFRFRLAPLGPSVGRRKSSRQDGSPGARTTQRDANSFSSRPFDPGRRPGERRLGVPTDPESQRVASEQADRAHQETLRVFGLWLSARRWKKLEEIDGAIDLRAQSPDGWPTIFEVKSITDAGERARVRGGLAQLLEYRLFLGAETDRLCLVSNRPISELRLRLLDSLGIAHAYVEDGEVQLSGISSSVDLFGSD